jgi:GTP cyclohydrolase II
MPSDLPGSLLVIQSGAAGGKAPLVRIHSCCLYGDVFGSLDCDCGAQLTLSLEMIRREGGGILIYADQEGRGCGLFYKAKGLQLKDLQGLDTLEAYRHLGLPFDLREYRQAALALEDLGIGHIRLLTNNPLKVQSLESSGIEVEQVFLRTKPTPANRQYLALKQQLGHSLGLDIQETEV